MGIVIILIFGFFLVLGMGFQIAREIDNARERRDQRERLRRGKALDA